MYHREEQIRKTNFKEKKKYQKPSQIFERQICRFRKLNRSQEGLI